MLGRKYRTRNCTRITFSKVRAASPDSCDLRNYRPRGENARQNIIKKANHLAYFKPTTYHDLKPQVSPKDAVRVRNSKFLSNFLNVWVGPFKTVNSLCWTICTFDQSLWNMNVKLQGKSMVVYPFEGHDMLCETVTNPWLSFNASYRAEKDHCGRDEMSDSDVRHCDGQPTIWYEIESFPHPDQTDVEDTVCSGKSTPTHCAVCTLHSIFTM